MDTHQQRIHLGMTPQQMALALAEGSPGAISVLSQLLSSGRVVDPDAWSPIATWLDLDMLGLYGSRIWMLYKDVCGHALVAAVRERLPNFAPSNAAA